VLPCPGSLARVTAPRWAVTIWRTMARPRPEPLTLADAAALPLTNFRKIALRSERAMPGPSSRTRIATQSLSLPHSIHIVGWPGEYLIALSTRLRSATEIASGSASTGHREGEPSISIWRPAAAMDPSNSAATRRTSAAASNSSNR